MGDMSDLELVAQAMALTENSTPKAAETKNGRAQEVSGLGVNATNDSNQAKESASPATAKPEIDLSKLDLDPSLLESLSLEDREAILPILLALQRAESGLANEDGDGDEAGDMAEILRVMNQAEGVADELEDKLDRLIRTLGEEEEGLKGATGRTINEKLANEKKQGQERKEKEEAGDKGE